MKRRCRLELLEPRMLMASNVVMGHRHNHSQPTDVDMNGNTSPLDALVVINELNTERSLRDRFNNKMADTNNDSYISPIDVLAIVNWLNDDSTPPTPDSPPRVPDPVPDGDTTGGGETGVLAVDDDEVLYLSATASAKPAITVDLLTNDRGVGLRVIAVGEAATGTTRLNIDPSGVSRTTVTYTPNEQSARFDFFRYTIEDESGNRSDAYVRIIYEVETDTATSFRLLAPETVQTTAGEEVAFRDANGAPLVQVEFSGNLQPTVGVLLMWSPPEGYYRGQRFAGTLGSTAAGDVAGFYEQPTGQVWISASLSDVNELLAGLYYRPADGFDAPDGIRLNIWSFFYTDLGLSLGNTSGSTDIRVAKSAIPSPEAVDDLFSVADWSSESLLDVFANDGFLNEFDPAAISVELIPSVGSDAELSWDAVARKVRFRYAYPVLNYDQFAYIIRTADGGASQGIATIVR